MNGHPKLKVCGMREEDNIREISALRPDYMGFIFYRASSRYVGDEFRMPNNIPSAIKKVGVFVNESVDHIITCVEQCDLQAVQLHGDEPPSLCSAIQGHGVEVIKVFSVGEKYDFKSTAPYVGKTSYFMFDTVTPGFGGSGKRFDWGQLKGYDQKVPFFLSGGLQRQAVEEALHIMNWNLHAFDLNTGVEFSPGIKDPVAIRTIQDIIGSFQGNKTTES